MSPKVLIINPDPITTTNVYEAFQDVGYILFHATNTDEGFKIIRDQQPTIIIIDLDFTKFHAFDFCRTLRLQKNNWTPLILLSEKDEEYDLVLGLELGADDYIRKPIRSKELVARVRSILRRQATVWPKSQTSETIIGDEIIINKDITISPTNFTVYVKGTPVKLTMKEFEVLLYLSKKKGTPIPRNELLSVVGVQEVLAEPRIIDVFISRIREKIEPCRRKPTYIKTVRNIGYMLV